MKFLSLMLSLLIAGPSLMAAPVSTGTEVKAELAQISKTLDTCLAQPDGQSEMGMKACTGAAYDAADKLLNKLYGQIVAQLSSKSGDASENAESLKRLQASERAWIAFRNADSSLAGTTDLGGTNEGLDVEYSAYSMTTARVLELSNLFSN